MRPIYEETPSGSETPYSTHDFVIQEVLNPDRQPIIIETDPTPISKEKSVKLVETAVRPRFSNRKVEPSLDRETRRVEYSFETSKFDHFAWLICRPSSGSLKT